MYQIGDKVMTWWQGKNTNGTIIEIVRAHCYRVQLWSGEIVYRHEDDLERRMGVSDREIYIARYRRALYRCGGAYALTFLPKAEKDALKTCTDLAAKTKMLEAIADRMEGAKR